MDSALEALERAFPTLGGRATSAGHMGWRAIARFFGTTPVSERARVARRERATSRAGPLRPDRAGSMAMLGRFDEARAILAESRAELAERGGGASPRGLHRDRVRLGRALAGDPAAAAEFGADGCRLLEQLGREGFLSERGGVLAQALYALDRLDEAEAWARRAAELGASDDAWTEMLWRHVKAKVLARRGEHAEAERLAREAVAIGDETDQLDRPGRRVRRPRGGAPARRKVRRRRRRARAGARTLRAQGEPRVRRARADTPPELELAG